MNYKKIVTGGMVSLLLGSVIYPSISFASTISDEKENNVCESNAMDKNVSVASMSNYLIHTYQFNRNDLKGLTNDEITSLYEYGYKAKVEHNTMNIKAMYKMRTMIHHLQEVSDYNLETIKPYINEAAVNDKLIKRGSVGSAISGSTFLYHLWRIAVDSHWGYRTIYDALYHYYRDVRHYSHKHAEEKARSEAHDFIKDTDRWDDILVG